MSNEQTLREMCINDTQIQIEKTETFVDAMFDSIQTGTLECLEKLTSIDELTWAIRAAYELLADLPLHIKHRQHKYPGYNVSEEETRTVFTANKEVLVKRKRDLFISQLRNGTKPTTDSTIGVPDSTLLSVTDDSAVDMVYLFESRINDASYARPVQLDEEIYEKHINTENIDISGSMYSGECGFQPKYPEKEKDVDQHMMLCLLDRTADIEEVDIDEVIYNKYMDENSTNNENYEKHMYAKFFSNIAQPVNSSIPALSVKKTSIEQIQEKMEKLDMLDLDKPDKPEEPDEPQEEVICDNSFQTSITDAFESMLRTNSDASCSENTEGPLMNSEYRALKRKAPEPISVSASDKLQLLKKMQDKCTEARLNLRATLEAWKNNTYVQLPATITSVFNSEDLAHFNRINLNVSTAVTDLQYADFQELTNFHDKLTKYADTIRVLTNDMADLQTNILLEHGKLLS